MVSLRSVLALTPFCTFLFASPAAAQGSDACATPQIISGPGPHAFNLNGMTTGPQGQMSAGCNINGSFAILNDVWFRWTAPSTGKFLVSSCLQTTVDTKIAVYPGSGCPGGAPLWCDDDWGGAQALAYINVTSGQILTIQLGFSPNGALGTGTGTFRILPVPAAIDLCANHASLGSSTGLFAFDCTGASTGTEGQSNPGCTSNPDDIWYSWTAPVTGMATLETCGQTTADTRIAVYSGIGCPGATSLACDDDACNLQSWMSWPVTAGVGYTIQIAGSSPVGGIYGTFLLEVAGPLSNDNCATPASLGAGSYDNTTATTGTQGQANLCGAIEQDLWFTWTATVNGSATISTCGTTAANTKLAVYAGAGCPGALALACDDNGCPGGGVQSEVTIPVTPGTTYTIQAGSPPGAPAGPASISIIETPTGTGPMTPFCFPGVGGIIACPCSNPPTSSGRGCNNFGAGPVDSAKIDASGVASLGSDTIVLSATDENNTPLTVFWQARDPIHPSGVIHAAGVRCVTATLKRLYTGIASGGAISRPGGSDPSVSARSMAVGDTILAGQNRHYFTIYRDPQAAGPCGNTSFTVNLTNAGTIAWGP